MIRMCSQARINLAALWNCWRVRSLKVYLIITSTPSSSLVFLLILLRKAWKAINPRYASVLPPPVGTQSTSRMSLSS